MARCVRDRLAAASSARARSRRNPPIPLATYTPTDSAMSGVTFRFAMRTAKSVAASAIWMNRPIFLISFFFGPVEGIEVANLAGNRAIEPRGVKVGDGTHATLPRQEVLPDFIGADAQPADQSTPLRQPAAHVSDSPLVAFKRPANYFLGPAVFLDVFDCVLHRPRSFSAVFVGNFDSKGLFKCHDQLDRIQRVRTQIVHEGSGGVTSPSSTPSCSTISASRVHRHWPYCFASAMRYAPLPLIVSGTFLDCRYLSPGYSINAAAIGQLNSGFACQNPSPDRTELAPVLNPSATRRSHRAPCR